MSAALFNEFISVMYEGNKAKAAEALGLGRSMVSRLSTGGRRISPSVALRIEQVSEGRYPKEQFVWPDDTAKQRKPRRRSAAIAQQLAG